MRSQIGLAPSAHFIPFYRGFNAVANRATASGTQDHIQSGTACAEGAKQQRERDLSRSCLGGIYYNGFTLVTVSRF